MLEAESPDHCGRRGDGAAVRASRVQLWVPEVGGRVDYASEHDEQAMTVLGLSSKREITRTCV
jgi:hypothetical protein